MLINNMAFDCSRTYYDTNRLLRTCAGHDDRYVEFRPTSVPGRLVMEAFLHLLLRHHTCCFLTGSFVNYVAGNFMSFGAALLFIVKADTQIQNLLFQRGMAITNIHLDGYHLTLTELHPDNDVCVYVFQRDGFVIPLMLFAIDTEEPFCNPFSILILFIFYGNILNCSHSKCLRYLTYLITMVTLPLPLGWYI
jgi:hypothetical protein